MAKNANRMPWLAGAVISYFIFALPLRMKNERLAVNADRVPELEEEIGHLRKRLEEIGTRNAELETIIKEERNRHKDRVEELTKMGDELERKFTVLAGKALGKNSVNFMQLVSERFEKHKEMANEELAKR